MSRKDRRLFGLHKNFQPRIHREYHDIDYIHKLSAEEKEWMSRFMEEYQHSKWDTDPDRDLHGTSTLRRDCQNASNRRRRCIYGVANVKGCLVGLSDRIFPGNHGTVHSKEWGKYNALQSYERHEMTAFGSHLNLDEDMIINAIDKRSDVDEWRKERIAERQTQPYYQKHYKRKKKPCPTE